MVAPVHPVPNDPLRLFKRLERMLSDTLFFETPKEPFNDPVLLRRLERDIFLLEAVIAACFAVSFPL